VAKEVPDKTTSFNLIKNPCLFAWLKNEGQRPSRARQWPFEEARFGEKGLAEERKPSKNSVNQCLRKSLCSL
jgi:hypothetical protein